MSIYVERLAELLGGEKGGRQRRKGQEGREEMGRGDRNRPSTGIGIGTRHGRYQVERKWCRGAL
jgi:hypothetical protein